MSAITINGGSAGVYQPGRCVGQYADPVPLNTFVSNPLTSVSSIHIVTNKQGVNATCKFIDESGRYEANAEVGYTDNCRLFTESGVWTNGTGTLTAAANNAPDGSDGGNVTVRCKFKAGDFTPNS